jgi:hypothetical protein
MFFDSKKFPYSFTPLLNSYIGTLKPSGISVYTPRISSGRACASVNIKRSVNASGLSPGPGINTGRTVTWTRVRRGNCFKKLSDPVTATGKMGQFASIANRADPVFATASPLPLERLPSGNIPNGNPYASTFAA